MAHDEQNREYLQALWDKGMPVSDAGWHFAEERERQGARDCEGRGAFQSRMIMMNANLFEQLRYRELLAIGIRRVDAAFEGVETVPSEFFDSRLENILKAFGDDGALYLAGRVWEQIRVVAPPLKQVALAPRGTKVEKTGRRTGRPRVDGQLTNAIENLWSSGDLDRKSRKQQEDLIWKKAQELYPTIFVPPRPSRSKILEILNPFLQSKRPV